MTSSIKQPIFGFWVCLGCNLVLSVGSRSLYSVRWGEEYSDSLVFGYWVGSRGGEGCLWLIVYLWSFTGRLMGFTSHIFVIALLPRHPSCFVRHSYFAKPVGIWGGFVFLSGYVTDVVFLL